jgi:hypothetical protein
MGTVRKAYLKKAAEYHPDKHSGTEDEDRATEAFQAINGERCSSDTSSASSTPSPSSQLLLNWTRLTDRILLQRRTRLSTTHPREKNTIASSPPSVLLTVPPHPNPVQLGQHSSPLRSSLSLSLRFLLYGQSHRSIHSTHTRTHTLIRNMLDRASQLLRRFTLFSTHLQRDQVCSGRSYAANGSSGQHDPW